MCGNIEFSKNVTIQCDSVPIITYFLCEITVKETKR